MGDVRRRFLCPYSKVVDSKDGQPFIISGSGTLGWDQVWFSHDDAIALGLTLSAIGGCKSRGTG